MFLSEPKQTKYDLSFNLFGFPVRVHPAFFILPLILGSSLLQNPNNSAGVTLIVLAAVFFVSVLVHELGHTIAFRYYGIPSRIVLYWMGGLAIPDSGNPWSQPKNSLNPHQQIVVSLAGPIFGFLLAALLMGIVKVMNGEINFGLNGIIPAVYASFPQALEDSAAAGAIILFLRIGIWANIFLNVLNLAPVYPLDGGQVARQVFILKDSWNGVRNSIILSIAAGGIIALISFSSSDRFMGFFFGFMAWSNYMSLQQMGGTGFGGGRPW